MTWFVYEGRPSDMGLLTWEEHWEQRRRRRSCMGRYVRALRAGKLRKPTICPHCGRTDVPSRLMHGHHADYDKPLEVVWACSTCHIRAHRAHDVATDQARAARLRAEWELERAEWPRIRAAIDAVLASERAWLSSLPP